MARLKRLLELQFIVALAWTFSSTAFAQITINIFDFDGTLLEDHQVREGAFNPEFILFRNSTRLSLFQDVATGPESVIVGHQDLEKMKPYLASGEGRPGAIGRTVKLSDGQTIKPGEYFLRYPDSYKLFREAPQGQNYLLRQFQDAERVASETGKIFKGSAWDYFIHLCETEAGARTVNISTARGHSEREWGELFEYLQKRDYIKFKPSPSRVYNMTRPEFDRYSGAGGALGTDPVNIPKRKANHLHALLLELRRVALPDRIPGEPRPLHEVRFFENSPENLDAIESAVKVIVFADQSPTRVTLVNVGLSTDIREARELGRPEVAVLEPGSAVFRSGSREHFMLPAKSSHALAAAPVIVRACESLFVMGAL